MTENTLQNSKELSRNRISYLLLSFNSGIALITELAINYYFKEQMGVNPSVLSQILTIIQFPWVIKPLFGLISDTLPICGYRRKYYMLIFGVINCTSLVIMGFVNGVFPGILCLLFANIADSFGSVLGQAIVVELSQADKDQKSANDLVIKYFLCKYSGTFLASFLKGYLIEKFSVQAVFLISSIFPIIMIISGFVLYEKPKNSVEKVSYQRVTENENHSTDNEVTDQSLEEDPKQENKVPEPKKPLIKTFIKFFFQKKIIIPIGYSFFLLSIPAYTNAFFYYSSDVLLFTPNDFGIISIVSTFVTLIAIWLYKKLLSKSSFKKITIILHCITVLSSFLFWLIVLRSNISLGISDLTSVTVATALFRSSNELTSMPILSLACYLCPKDLEGSVYAMFISAINFGEILSGFLGSLFTESFGIQTGSYENFALLILIINILEIVPVFVLIPISSSYFPMSKPQIEVKEVTIKQESKQNIEMSQN